MVVGCDAQVMMKLKNSRNLDARQSMLLDNAYFAVRPPERVGARRKRRPPMQEYMRYLTRECLTKDEVKPVCAPFSLSHSETESMVRIWAAKSRLGHPFAYLGPP